VSEAVHSRAGPAADLRRAIPPVLLLAAAAATGGAVYVIAVSRIAPNPAAQSLLTALVCLTFAGAGVAALRLRPYARFGLLLAAVGFASLISVLHEANAPAPYTIGVIGSNVLYPVFLHALLAYPGGRLAAVSRRLVAAAYVLVLGLQVLAVLVDPLSRYHSAHPRNLVLIESHEALATGLYELEAAVVAVLSLIAIGVLARRLRAATPATRRQHLPVVAGGATALVLFSVGLALVPLSSRAGLLGFGLALVAALALPLGFVATLVEGRLSRAAVGELLLELRDPEQAVDLEEALRRALGDPSLRLGRLAADGGYVDDAGVALPLPARGEPQVATGIRGNGKPLGMLVHDRSLCLRPELLDAVTAAAGFAIATEGALRRVQKVEDRNRALLGAIPDLMLRVDAEGTYLDARASEPAAFPYRPDELIGRNVRDVAPPRVADAILACARRALETGELQSVEYELEIDGVVRYCESRMVPSGNAEVVIIMRDFTDKRRVDSKLRRLVAEQAALRRVATRVAENAPPEQVFQLVTEEVCRLLGLRTALLARFGGNATATVVGKFGAPTGVLELGNVVALESEGTAGKVFATGAPARADYSPLAGEAAAELLRLGFVGSVGVPITVAGETWGVLVVALQEREILGRETEHRLQAFAELVGLAVASADARDELAASRLRIVEASDNERRRLERNLHDGAQQRLVTVSLGLRFAQSRLRTDPNESAALLESLSGEVAGALTELRELAQGIHPAVLTDRGLGPALEVLAARMPLPVELRVDLPERLPEPVETAAYYAVSEALTNVTKHAEACSAAVRVACAGDTLTLEVSDDGAGGADPEGGSGLRGLCDRIETLGGELWIDSVPGEGTVLRAEVPVRSKRLAAAGREQ
jgi:PAS domain S-box-containing protein